jgi:hypothetical protein
MSGRSRGKGKGGGRVKRQEVESEDGWTVITHGLAKMNVHGKTPKSKKEVGGLLPSKMVEGLTAEKLLEEFKKLQERWDDTAVAKQIGEFLSTRTWDVKDAACIGIGSFSRDWDHRHRSMWQLVLFVSVVQHSSGDSRVYAQDPAFTPLDTEFLELLHITTLSTGIETHITPNSFVYSPFMDWYILLPVFLKDKDPALYVGNEVLDDYSVFAQTEDKKQKLAECNNLGKTFLDHREKMKMREFESHAHALNGMVIYSKAQEKEAEAPS